MSRKKIKSLKYLELEIGGYFADGSRLRFKDSKVQSSLTSFVFGEFDGHNSAVNKVTPEQERIFIEGLNDINVVNWSGEYIDHQVMDGTQWTLKLQYNGNLRKHIHGSNKYPRDFIQLLELCNSIAEKPAFKIESV